MSDINNIPVKIWKRYFSSNDATKTNFSITLCSGEYTYVFSPVIEENIKIEIKYYGKNISSKEYTNQEINYVKMQIVP